MPVNITPVDAFTDPVQGPADGEAVNSANAILGLQDLADRTLYCNNRIVGTNQGQVIDVPFSAEHSGTAVWSPDTWGFSQVSDATAGADFHIVLPASVNRIDAVFARLRPAGSHAGLPGSMPRLKLFEADFSTSGVITFTELEDIVDPSASVAAYELTHSFDSGAISHVVAPGLKQYFFRFTGEQGTNFKTGLQLFRLWLTVHGD